MACNDPLFRGGVAPPASVRRSLVRTLQGLFRRRWIVVNFLAATVLVIMGASYVFPPVYSASAKLLVIPGSENLPIFTLSSTVADRVPTTSLQVEDVLSEMELMQSRPILERVVDRIGLDHREKIDLGEPAAPASPMKQRIVDALRAASDSVKAFLVDLDLISVTGDREKAVNDLRNRIRVRPIRSTNVFTLDYADSDPKLAAMIVNALAEEYLSYRKDVYRPLGAVEHFREKLEVQKADLKAAKERLRVYQDQQNITNLEVEIENTIRLLEEAKKNGAFNQQVDQYTRRLAALRAAAPVIRDLRFEVEDSERIYERYLQKYDEVTSNAELSDAKFANVRLIEAATPNWEPAFPHRLTNLFLSLFLGLGGGVGMALAIEYFTSKVNAVEDVEAAGVLALGSVPRLTRRRERRVAFAADRSLQALSIIAQQVQGKVTRSGFVLTGVARSVGCTTVSAGLALVLARRAERKLLIVEADIRKPRLNQLFRAVDAPVVDTAPDRHVGLAPMIRPTKYANIDILTLIGPAPMQIDGAAMLTLLNGSRSNYDCVVVDAPPLLSSATALALAQEMDNWGVILVADAGRTSKQVLRRAAELVQRQGVGLLGAILNRREDSVPSFIYRRL